MALPEANFIALSDLLKSFNSAYAAGGAYFTNIQSIGNLLYSNADMVTEYPSSSAAFKTYLLTLNTAITNFLASVPAPVTLSN